MFKKSLLTLCYSGFLLVLLSFADYGRGDCSRHKNGNFFFKPAGTKGYKISRQDSVQTETDLSTGYYAKYKVKWLNEYTYEVKNLFESSNPEFKDDAGNLKVPPPLKFEILLSEKDYYIFRIKTRNVSPIIDTIWVDL